MSEKDGGPAFPRPCWEGEQFPDHGANGMSLRDWFAGHALAGLLGSGVRHETVQRAAYLYADAMLAERAKRKEDPS